LLKLPLKDTDTQANLIACFKDNLETLTKSLSKKLADCKIGLLTCDTAEDIYQMNYFKNVISPISKNCDVLTTTILDFDQHNQVFNSSTGAKYDILFNWFPLELSSLYAYPDGSYFHELLAKSIDSKKIVVFNGKSFLAQNKYFLCWLQEQGIPADLQEYWTPSFYTEQEVTSKDWIAKPIWGRQGSGIFGKQTILGKEKDFSGDLSDDYFNSQYFIYQQMWSSYPVTYNNETYKTTLEKFVYKTNAGWKVGGHGLRISKSNIANNDSSWLAIK
jgi:glutathionylspermidine synthase